MIGAPALVARAALRAGCGLVKLLVPEPIADACVSLCPSATAVPLLVEDGFLIASEVAEIVDPMLGSLGALVVGPGLGDGPEITPIALRALQQEDTPVVLDADAINALVGMPELSREVRAAAILTPHPGEYKRLASTLRLRHDPVAESSRPLAAEELAQRLGCIVVLKGRGTVVSDGHRTWINDTGSDVLATGGTGDVLAGLIAGLVAAHAMKMDGLAAALRKLKRPGVPTPTGLSLYDIARIAVRAHGIAARSWTESHHASAGLLAQELADLLPRALETMRARG